MTPRESTYTPTFKILDNTLIATIVVNITHRLVSDEVSPTSCDIFKTAETDESDTHLFVSDRFENGFELIETVVDTLSTTSFHQRLEVHLIQHITV